ncbi:MAG: urease accessory protein UreF [Aestuariivirga sp.]|nr:urease accessory protein UreF [Aestuariivirga sp.]
MAITTEPQQLLQLLAFMSPAFPVGGFAYSHGLERAIDDGVVASADDVREWIESLLVHGSGWNDAVLFAQAFDADEAALTEIDELALALAASRERALETSDLGQSFAKAVAMMSVIEDMHFQTYPVAVAAACQKACIDKYAGMLAYLQAFSNNLIAVAVRLVPLGQSKGLEVMRDMMPVVSQTAERAMCAILSDLGSSTLLADIAAMKHEIQYSRVFRS